MNTCSNTERSFRYAARAAALAACLIFVQPQLFANQARGGDPREAKRKAFDAAEDAVVQGLRQAEISLTAALAETDSEALPGLQAALAPVRRSMNRVHLKLSDASNDWSRRFDEATRATGMPDFAALPGKEDYFGMIEASLEPSEDAIFEVVGRADEETKRKLKNSLRYIRSGASKGLALLYRGDQPSAAEEMPVGFRPQDEAVTIPAGTTGGEETPYRVVRDTVWSAETALIALADRVQGRGLEFVEEALFHVRTIALYARRALAQGEERSDMQTLPAAAALSAEAAEARTVTGLDRAVAEIQLGLDQADDSTRPGFEDALDRIRQAKEFAQSRLRALREAGSAK